jgi:hypothetical protein
MIKYAYKFAQSGMTMDGYADKIRVCYTPDAIRIMLLLGTFEVELLLSNTWEPNSIVEFQCDKFYMEAE